MKDNSSRLSRGVPTPLSGYRENLSKTDRTRPLIGRSSADKASLTLFEETPMICAGGAEAYVRPGTVLALYYLNAPRIDTYYWRALARKVRKYIREFNVNSPGRSFFAAYPELRLNTVPENALDDTIQTEALIHALRSYVEAATYAACAVANHRIMSTVGDDTPYARYSSSLRWSAFNSQNRFLNGYPIPKALLNYVIENTKPLADVDINGVPVGAFPQWRLDPFGYTSQFTTPMRSLSPDETLANNINLAKLMAAKQFLGVRPNVRPNCKAGAVHEELLADEIAVDTATIGTEGYIPSALNASLSHWAHLLRTDQVFAAFKSASHPLNNFFTKIIPVLDGVMDIESMDKAIRDNTPGSVTDFASANMVYAGSFAPTLSHSSRTLHTRDVSAEYLGVYMSTNDEYANAMRQEITVGGGTAPVVQWYEPYYAATVTKDGDGVDRADPIRIGDIFANDLVNAGTEPGAFEIMRLGNASKRTGAFLGLPGTYPPQSAAFVGLSTDDLSNILAPGSFGDKPFMIREEFEAGITIVRSMVTPLIDVWDPSQCGFYVVKSGDASYVSHWWDYISAMTDSLIAAQGGAPKTLATLIEFSRAESSYQDAIFYVGDGLLLGPDVMQARPGCGFMYEGQYASDFVTMQLWPLWNVEGYPLAKPFTLDPPMNLELWDTDDATDDQPHLVAWDGLIINDTASIVGWASSTSWKFMAMGMWVWFWKELIHAYLPNELRKKFLPYSFLPTVRAVNLVESYMTVGEEVATSDIDFPGMPSYQFGTGVLEEETKGRAISLAKPKFVGGSRVDSRSSPSYKGGKSSTDSPWRSKKRSSSSSSFRSSDRDSPIPSIDSKEPITSAEIMSASSPKKFKDAGIGTEVLQTPSESNAFTKEDKVDKKRRR